MQMGIRARIFEFCCSVGRSGGAWPRSEVPFYVQAFAWVVTVCVLLARRPRSMPNYFLPLPSPVTFFVRPGSAERKSRFLCKAMTFDEVTFNVHELAGSPHGHERGFDAKAGNGFCADFGSLCAPPSSCGGGYWRFALALRGIFVCDTARRSRFLCRSALSRLLARRVSNWVTVFVSILSA